MSTNQITNGRQEEELSTTGRLAYVQHTISLDRIFGTVNSLLQEFEVAGYSTEQMDVTRVLTEPLDTILTFLTDTMQGAPAFAGLSRHLSSEEQTALLSWIKTLKVSEIWEGEELDPDHIVQVKVDGDSLGVAGIEMANIPARVRDVFNPTRVIS